VPPLGALAERVEGSGAGWLMTQSEWDDAAALLDRIVALGDEAATMHVEPAKLPASAALGPLAAMTQATLARYDEAVDHAGNAHPRFSRERVRDAAGYRTWYPLVKSTPMPRIGVESIDARSAAGGDPVSRLRATLFGRLAVRLTPRRVRSALRSHLR